MNASRFTCALALPSFHVASMDLRVASFGLWLYRVWDLHVASLGLLAGCFVFMSPNLAFGCWLCVMSALMPSATFVPITPPGRFIGPMGIGASQDFGRASRASTAGKLNARASAMLPVAFLLFLIFHGWLYRDSISLLEVCSHFFQEPKTQMTLCIRLVFGAISLFMPRRQSFGVLSWGKRRRRQSA